MPKNITYAVVDIETTGTDPKTDRIIQFGCVLIKNGKIINRFATDINPDRKVPKQIQSLTQITNARVQKAPYFEDVAYTIYNLLSDTTFVAHNIFFDYHFLNQELLRCGVSELTIPGIDTVELAQIFLPCETSFRLNDLAESLGLTHDNPHQADSDAEVTGALLLYMEAKMRELPAITLQMIAEKAQVLAMETGTFIQQVAQEVPGQSEDLADDLEIVSGLALKKKTVPLFQQNYYPENYPTKKRAKEKLYAGHLHFRKEQARLMNLVYKQFTEEVASKDLLIEAATGMGKSIGYLLPANFLATPENPVIISTVSLLLQEQLMEKDIPLLNGFFQQPIQATIIKSHRHYLDLQRFKGSLSKRVEQKQYVLYQLGTLVWLTQTTTGDLDELNLISQNHQFFQDVRHRGIEYLQKDKDFYEQDFLRFLQKKIQQSNFLIVNHAFLAQETVREQPALPKSDYLIIDEAHHLPAICERVSQKTFDTVQFKKQVAHLLQSEGLLEAVKNLLKEQPDFLRGVALYQSELQAIVEVQEEMTAELNDWTNDEPLILEKQTLTASDRWFKNARKLMIYYEECLLLQAQLQKSLRQHDGKWLAEERQQITALIDFFESMLNQITTMKQWLNEWHPRYVHWFFPNHQRSGGSFQVTDFEAAILPQTKWYQRYQRIVYVSGTLKVTGDRLYFPKKLGIPNAQVKVIPTPFDEEQQLRILLPDKGVSIQQMTADEYSNYLAQAIEQLVADYPQPVLVLFTAHDILQRVYDKLHMKFLVNGREIFAQGIGGSREKILKKFHQSDSAILFGADSFWEGIDLPGEALQLVIVTRLPFENPKRPATKAYYDFLEAQGSNPFFEEAIPKATLRLRQGMGRLIRSKNDRGVMILLDRRLITTKYGKRIKRALPKKITIQELPLPEMAAEIRTFLKNPQKDGENHK